MSGWRLLPALFALLVCGTSVALAAPKKTSKSSKSRASKRQKKPAPAEVKKPPFPCSALPWTPILLTNRVVRERETAKVTQDLLLAERTAPALREPGRLHVSFGAPGLPLSMRVAFLPLREGELGAPEAAAGEPELAYVQAPESEGACTVLGRPEEAGVNITLPIDLRTDATSKLAILRIEQHVHLGHLPNGSRDLVLRLSPALEPKQRVRVAPLQSLEPVVLELCGRGQTSERVLGGWLQRDLSPQQDLCVTFSGPPSESAKGR